MKNKLLVILIAAIGILLSAFLITGKMYLREKSKRVRTEGNQTALLTDMLHYKTADSLNAVKIQTLELTEKELKASNINYLETIDKLNIKNKRLTSLLHVEMETVAKFKAAPKDSFRIIPVIDTVGSVPRDSIVLLKCMEYKDPSVSFIGCYDNNDSMDVNIIVPVTLDAGGSYVPKYFLGFIPYGFDHAELDIKTDNKYTDIKYAESIELKKKRRKQR